jgi:hypothetical protein
MEIEKLESVGFPVTRVTVVTFSQGGGGLI